MKLLVSEIIRVYKKSPFKILIIWIIDFLESLIIAANPYIIGRCIDELLQKKYFWFTILIVIEFIYGILHAVNKYIDTRVYSKIVEEEHNRYYEEVCYKEVDVSIISSHLDLVDSIPIFLEINAFPIFNMIFGIISSLIFLYFKTNKFLFFFAVSLFIFILIATHYYRSKIIFNNEKYKIFDEKRIASIIIRNTKIYSEFIKKILKIEIENSDFDTKIFLIIHILQTILLFFSIFVVINTENFSSGLLISTITYIEFLNTYYREFNDNIILLKDLQQTVKRLNKNISL